MWTFGLLMDFMMTNAGPGAAGMHKDPMVLLLYWEWVRNNRQFFFVYVD
jgi:hypothetical protein